MSTPAVVELRGLETRFGRTTALAGIDLDIGDRRIFGVVGPDGAGKTTLLRALAGLLEVRAQRARVLGVDLTGDVSELKAKVGYVPQSFGLHRDLTVAENLRFTARLHRMPDGDYRRRAKELLEHAGLSPFVDRPAGALSGGMRQKLAMTNALLPQPRLLVLDEPTAGVDVVARGELWAMLEKARESALVVISTSYVDEAAACNSLAYLDRGRIVATGTPDALRAGAPLVPYRAWGDDPRAIARSARLLAYVASARAAGRYARIEIYRARSPGDAAVLDALGAMPGVQVALAERREPDMESTLLALAGHS